MHVLFNQNIAMGGIKFDKHLLLLYDLAYGKWHFFYSNTSAKFKNCFVILVP